MRILITGGAGYLGSVLTRVLLGREHKVRVLDNFMYGEEPLLGILPHPNVQVIRGDITHQGDLARALDGIEHVVHLAAIVGDPACSREPKLAKGVNLEGTAITIDLCKTNNIKKFVFASTCSNYGVTDASILADEETPLHPVSLYAETKVYSEQYVLEHVAGSFCPCVLRLSTLFGISPRMRFDLLINTFTRDAVLYNKIRIYNPHSWRPYVHVLDAAEVLALCLESPAERIRGMVFNVGDNAQNYEKCKIGEMVRDQIPGVRLEYVEDRKQDPRSYRVSFDKIRCTLSYRTQWDVRMGIKEVRAALEQGMFPCPESARYTNSEF